jgi:DnaJ-class molecular chaperone
MRCIECKGKGTVIAEILGWGIKAEVNCETCQGTGKTGEPGVCPKCNGSKHMIYGGWVEVDCDMCNGTGLAQEEVA